MYGLEAVHHSVFLASIWLSIPHMTSCFLRETYYSKSILGSWFSVSQRLLSCKEEKALKPAQGRSKRVQIPWRQNGVRPHGTWSCEGPTTYLHLIYFLSLLLCGVSSVLLSLSPSVSLPFFPLPTLHPCGFFPPYNFDPRYVRESLLVWGERKCRREPCQC